MEIKKISIIIPCFNEENYIGETLKSVFQVKLQKLEKEIIIVDDGSYDNSKNNIIKTKLQFKIKNLIVIRHNKNLGKGAAIRSGMKHSTGDVVIIQDADTEYNPDQYRSLLRSFTENNASVVYGSRTLGITVFGNKYSNLFFYLGGRALTWYMNLLFGIKLTDQPTGYKLFRKDVIPLLVQYIHDKGFSAEIEITAILAKKKIPIVEVPVRYTPRTIQQGKKIRIADFFKAIIIGLRCFFKPYGNKRFQHF